MNVFQGTGNVGSHPEKKMITAGGEERQLVTFRCFFTVPKTNGEGEYDNDADRGFWADVNIWREGLGDRVNRHIQRGSRVFVQGRMERQEWENRDGETRAGLSIQASYVAADLIGVSSITFAKGAAADTAAEDEAA